MLRIDLLPPYVHERRARPVFFGIAAAIVAAVIIAFVAWYISLSSTLGQLKQQLDSANSLQSQYQDYQTKVQQVNSSIADIKSKQDFIASAQKYNDSWWKAYTAVATDTSPYILLHSMEIDPRNHNLVHLTGFCPNEMELARWWIFLRNDTAKFQSVYITMPAHPYPPESANQNGNQAYGGFGSYGPPKGAYGMGGPMGPMTSSPMSSSPYGMGGGPPGMPPGMPYGMSGMPGSPYGGMMGGGNSNNGVATPTEIEGRKGIDFSADLVLQDSLAPPATAPTWPPSGQGGGAGAAGMGGYSMMPPGMPGMPGGMPGYPGGAMGSRPPSGGGAAAGGAE